LNIISDAIQEIRYLLQDALAFSEKNPMISRLEILPDARTLPGARISDRFSSDFAAPGALLQTPAGVTQNPS
jgi:hypothetical protein